MTRHARFQLPERDPHRPTVPEVLPLVRACYAKPENSVGGILHVVLDDGNLALSHLDWAWEQAFHGNDEDALQIVDKLRKMTPTQRRTVVARFHREPIKQAAEIVEIA